MMIRTLAAATVAALLTFSPTSSFAQDADAANRLRGFVEEISGWWEAADAEALVERLPADDRLVLDTGVGIESVNGRHAAAALRALFAHSETLSTRILRVTVASMDPARGFGEIEWTFRSDGAPGQQTRSIYVAGVENPDGWRLSELRLMP